MILTLRTSWPIGTRTSPFDGVFDLYGVGAMPLVDVGGQPLKAAVYTLDRRIPGAVEAPPERTTVIS